MGTAFFDDFKKVNKKQWLEKATKDLTGEDPNGKFGWEAEPGLPVSPYYDLADLEEISRAFQNRLLETAHPSGNFRHWDNLQKIEVHNEVKANAEALNALQGGADGLIFDLPTVQVLNFDKLLKNIQLPYCTVWFKIGGGQERFAQALINHQSIQSLEGGLICTDTLYPTLYKAFEGLPNIRLAIAGEPAPFTEKIAGLLARTSQLAHQLSENQAHEFFARHSVVFPVGKDFFGEIAALRAFRQLYFQMARAYGATAFNPEDLKICAQSTVWAVEAYNPHANMLKSTTAGMAAVLGGCNALWIEPEDINNPMMARTARNVSNILKEEAYLNSAVDPAAGAYYLESLTEKMAKSAWVKFQQKS